MPLVTYLLTFFFGALVARLSGSTEPTKPSKTPTSLAGFLQRLVHVLEAFISQIVSARPNKTDILEADESLVLTK
jgi:hypothetical protein